MASQVIALAGFFITMIVLIVSYFRTRHVERMALIKNEKSAIIFDVKKSDSNTTLKFGLLLLSIGFGLLVGLIIDRILGTEPAATFISILILGGVSLVFYHVYVERQKPTSNNQNDDLV